MYQLTFNCRGGDKKEKKKILEYVFYVQKWIPTQAGTRLRRTDYTQVLTLIMFYKQRFISNDFLTSLFLKKIKQRTSLFSKN